MGKTFRTLAVWASLAAFAVSGLMPSGSLVLCFTPTGEVFLETSTVGAPCGGCPEIQRSQDSSSQLPQLDRTSSGCPCVDLPLGISIGSLEKRLASSKSQDGILSVCSTFPKLESRDGEIQRSLYTSPGSSYHSLLQVRTVVLLV